MATATLDKPKPTHREVTPIRECESCGAYLRSFNPASVCEPCERRPELTEAEAIERVAAIKDYPRRRKAFQALASMQAEREALEERAEEAA